MHYIYTCILNVNIVDKRPNGTQNEKWDYNLNRKGLSIGRFAFFTSLVDGKMFPDGVSLALAWLTTPYQVDANSKPPHLIPLCFTPN